MESIVAIREFDTKEAVCTGAARDIADIIAEAIADGDVSLAVAATRVHLNNALQHALRTKELAPAHPAAS